MSAYRERDYTTGLETEDDIVSRVRDLYVDARKRFDELHREIAERVSFGIDMEHYVSDVSAEERQLNLIRPKDPGMFRVWAYLVALFMQRFPVHVEVIPEERGPMQPELEQAKRALEDWVNDDGVDYDLVRERVVGGGLCGGAWAAELQYSENTGLVVVDADPRNYFWAEGYKHPQDRRNPWTMRRARVPVAEVRAMFGSRVPLWLKGDDGFSPNDEPGIGAQSAQDGEGDGGLVTLVFFRSRYEEPKKRSGRPSERMVQEDMRYMSCASCEYRTPPQGEMMVAYPALAPGACPHCGADMSRVDWVDGEKYAEGKRLVICAPFSGMTEPFYDDDWEFDYPTFPLLWWSVHNVPHKSIGPSRTSVLKTPTLVSNAMLLIAYQTMLRSRPYYARPDLGVQNYLGEEFGFGELDGDVMYYSRDYVKNPVEVVQGLPMNPQTFALLDRAQMMFKTNEGTSEVAMTSNELSNVKVGALEQQQQSGNVVIDRQGARFYVEESRLLSCVAAALREMRARDVRYRQPTGEWGFQLIGGETMPKVSVKVGSGYSLEKLDEQDVKVYMMLKSLSPEDRRNVAALNHADPSIVAMIEKAESEAARRMATMPGAVMGGAQAPTGGQPNLAGRMNGRM